MIYIDEKGRVPELGNSAFLFAILKKYFIVQQTSPRFLLLYQEAGAVIGEKRRKMMNYLFFLASRKSFSSALIMSVMNIWPGA